MLVVTIVVPNNKYDDALNKVNNKDYAAAEELLVSSDIVGMRFGSLFDATQTMVTKVDEGLYQVQVVSWYDNENSYTSQMVRTIKYFAEHTGKPESEIAADMERDFFMSAEDALSYGIVDKVMQGRKK